MALDWTEPREKSDLTQTRLEPSQVQVKKRLVPKKRRGRLLSALGCGLWAFGF
jgi:hypothetical protein